MRNVLIGLLLLPSVLFVGCTSDELAGTQLSNKPPSVWLSSAPPEGTVSNYTLHLFWGGWDPDGEISYYEYIITNNETGVFDPADTVSTTGDYKWNPVVVNDSIFGFTADVALDSTDFSNNELEPEEFRRSHTFFIRAVDEQGLRSTKPAYRSFTSRTLSPTVRVTVPTISGQGLNPAQVPPITTFQWRGTDFISTEGEVQEPDSVRWIVVSRERAEFNDDWGKVEAYVQTNPDAVEWSEWHYYQAPGDTGKFFTTPPLDFGPYMFAVQVKDEAGAVSPVFDRRKNMARFLVSTRSTGPVFTVRNQFLGTIVTSSPNTTPTILDLPAGVAMQFEFEADASSYGGIVSGYRYGWDILDLNDDEQWEIDFTPFIGDVAKAPSRTFFFGSHTFNVEVVDNSGFKSRVGVTVNIIPFTMTRPLRVIDDVIEAKSTSFAGSGGALAGGGERDAFWVEVLDNVAGFDPTQDVFSVGIGNPTVPITQVADYQNIIWNSTASHNFNSSSVVAEMVRFKDPRQPVTGGKSSPNIPALFMAAGGHLLLAGQEAMSMTINRLSFTTPPAYPVIFRYELTGDQDGRYTGDNNDVGVFGVGERGFAYNECCLNVLDIAYIANPGSVRREPGDPPGTACPVRLIRSHNGRLDGLRTALPIDPAFPPLNLRQEVAGDATKFYYETKLGLNCDIYNPQYFADLTDCDDVSEYLPARGCFQPIYGLGCLDQSSVVFGATVAFWTTQFAGRVPDVGGVAARSAVWGFQPVMMDPDEVKAALAVILHDEWQLQRKSIP